ncbi:MAG TPA: hypothetical protein DEO59_17040 [Balneola sp.]|jgi:hypothetical protein|nr:hypothetical protein [Balneola sp.]
MKAGDVYKWLDQGPVILLEKVKIPDPITLEELEEEYGTIEEFRKKSDWPTDTGWKVKLVTTSEVLDVHEETLREVK